MLGYDGRSSSFAIQKIISAVLMSMGIDVYTMGMTPTPCLQFTVKNLRSSGGIMITASHNPKEYNGIKPISSHGFELSRDDEIKIESIYYQKEVHERVFWFLWELIQIGCFGAIYRQGAFFYRC